MQIWFYSSIQNFFKCNIHDEQAKEETKIEYCINVLGAAEKLTGQPKYE